MFNDDNLVAIIKVKIIRNYDSTAKCHHLSHTVVSHQNADIISNLSGNLCILKILNFNVLDTSSTSQTPFLGVEFLSRMC